MPSLELRRVPSLCSSVNHWCAGWSRRVARQCFQKLGFTAVARKPKPPARCNAHRAFTLPYPVRPFSVLDILKGQLCPPSVPPCSRGRVSPSHGKKCGLIACQGGWLPGLAKGGGKCYFSPLIHPHSLAGQPDGPSPLTST